jgi:oxygen-independent coproporphyrinogen III oxidase
MKAALPAELVIDVPRYTSYPTAAEFSAVVDAGAHASNLRAAATTASRPLSLYVHLPFCKSICHFCGCHALVARTDDRIERYMQALRTEMSLVGEAMGVAPRIGELHFGGGSPSLLEVPVFERLMADLMVRFAFIAEATLSLEADPRTVDRTKLQSYRQQGISRLSFGFQDLDENVQHAIGHQ